MNVIVFLLDSLRRDHLGAYGNPWIQTPNLDRFAAESTVFDRAYIGSYPCLPHRRDVWTGRYEFPMRGWGGLEGDDCEWPGIMSQLTYRPGCQLPEAATQPPDRISMLILDNWLLVSPAGNYHRTFAGWHFIRGQEGDRWVTDRSIPIEFPCDPSKLRQPYRDVAQHLRNNRLRTVESEYHSPRVMQAAMDWLEANRSEQGFCLWIDCFDPHEPWDPPYPYNDLYDPGYHGESVVSPRYGPSNILTPSELRHAAALYAGEVTMVDRWVGRALEKIDQLGLRETTMVIVTGDHGHLLGEHATVGKPFAAMGADSNLYDELARVPLLVRVPGVGSSRSAALVQPVDLYPTILEAVGLNSRGDPLAHGRSLLPLVRGEADRIRELAVFGRYHEAVNVTDGRYTAFVWPEGDPRSALYDGESDPQQAYNLVEGNAAKFAEMWSGARDWMRSIGASTEMIERKWTIPERFP